MAATGFFIDLQRALIGLLGFVEAPIAEQITPTLKEKVHHEGLVAAGTRRSNGYRLHERRVGSGPTAEIVERLRLVGQGRREQASLIWRAGIEFRFKVFKSVNRVFVFALLPEGFHARVEGIEIFGAQDGRYIGLGCRAAVLT